MSTSDLTTLRLERTFAASPEEVFDAWTNPSVLERWWGRSPGGLSPACEVDLRVGGRYRLSMSDGQDAPVHTVGGEYREVERPDRLVYTWCWEGTDGPYPGHVSVVTVEFRPEGERTTVVLEHSELASEESRTGHAAGWDGALENLARRVFERDGSR
jgi:uncharacterized protein YndB with AHSA1/START domain